MTLYELLGTVVETTLIDIMNGENIIVSNESVVNARIPFYLLPMEVDYFYPALLNGDGPNDWTKSKIVIHMASV